MSEDESTSSSAPARDTALVPFTPPPVPARGDDLGLSRYLSRLHAYPLLEEEEEFLLARRWRQDGDKTAAERLVLSHLRLVARIAIGYRGYGLPLSDLISEGGVGLMEAVRRFDPERRVRLSTYASWWIRAAIQEYVLRSWSLVRLGSSAKQKRLFYKLRSTRARLAAYGDVPPEQLHARIAQELDVSEDDVREMEQRLVGGDLSLDAPMPGDGQGEESGETWLARVPSSEPTPEERVVEDREHDLRARLLQEALDALEKRDREILVARRLRDKPATLETLSAQYGISRERVRQLEQRAYARLRQNLVAGAERAGILPKP